MMSEQYQKGKLNGVTKTYYYTGELYEIKNWTQGVENGSWIQYFINGATKMEILINHGVREGKIVYYFPSGKVYYNGFILLIINQVFGNILLKKESVIQ